MAIQVSGKKALQDSWLTIRWAWSGDKFISVQQIEKLIGPNLKAVGYDISQTPVVRQTTVPVSKAKEDVPLKGLFKGDCIATAADLRAANVPLQTVIQQSFFQGKLDIEIKPDDPRQVDCSGKVSALTWNIRRTDKERPTDTDAGLVRNAIRIARIQSNVGPAPVGVQPGAVKFTGEVPILPPIGYALAGVAMITLAANLRQGS